MLTNDIEDSLTESKGDIKDHDFSSADVHDEGDPNTSIKSAFSRESHSISKSTDIKLDLSDSESERSSQDTPDSSSPVYRSTTELIESTEEKHMKGCWCCCYRVEAAWGTGKKLASEFTHRQWRMLTMLCLGTLTSSLSVCLFPPFFPKLAESKGETATMYGMVIGTNCLTAFFVTPIIGKNMENIGVNFAFVVGMFGSGSCCSLSGFLEYFNPGYQFVLISILIRVLHATANACVITSTIAFIASEFPNSVPFLFSLTRATMNLAQMFGPALGGALHNAGGFKMPFFVLGSVQVIVSLICGYYLPSFKGKPKNEERSQKKGIWSIFKIPGIWIAFITFVLSTMSNGFLSITLEPLVLRQFDISPFYVGVLFGLKDGANCFASPVWGWMCDRIGKLKLLIVIGSLMAALSFVLLGPFPGLPIQHTIWLVIIALILNGFGVGGQQVAGVVSAMKDTVDAGYPDEPDTHAFVASLWSSLSGAGRFVSRAGSGILVDRIGFRPTSAIVTSLHIFILAISLLYTCVAEFKEDKTDRPVSKRRKSYHQIHVDHSPTEPLVSKSVNSKSASVAVPVVREDLEDSFMLLGSASSVLVRN